MVQQKQRAKAALRRVYVPASAATLLHLAESGAVEPLTTVHTVTSWLEREAPGADVEDLEYTAFADASMASIGLLVGQAPRRVVISADVPEHLVSELGEGTAAEVSGSVTLKQIAAIHMDDADAAVDIAAVLGSAEDPDLDVVEAHVLDWYAPAELQELLAALA